MSDGMKLTRNFAPTGTGTGIWAMERKWIGLFFCQEPEGRETLGCGAEATRAVTPVSHVVLTSLGVLFTVPGSIGFLWNLTPGMDSGWDSVDGVSREAADGVWAFYRRPKGRRANHHSRRQVPQRHHHRHRSLP